MAVSMLIRECANEEIQAEAEAKVSGRSSCDNVTICQCANVPMSPRSPDVQAAIM